MIRPMDRTALFIDAGYLDKLCQEVFGVPSGGRKIPLALNFKQLPAALADAKPWKTFYYHCLPYQDDPPLPAQFAAREAKKRFLGFIGILKGWELREGRLEKRGDSYIQKRVDVLLAVDLTRLAWRQEIKQAVLVSGDADFVPAVEDARAAGVHVTLRYAPGTAHADLVAACNAARPLTREGLEAIRLT
ncbi:MAG: hypothetical protein JWM80_5402 [Cyanobacteria bacterium RYN_339]|nr:hypothetical protein [Cyanobacteria bacterium RYN_339]